MSSRNRGRANPNQDTDEERRLWMGIKERAKEVDSMVARSNEIGYEIIQIEEEQSALVKADKIPSAALDERLEALYRENVKLTEEVTQILDGKSNEMNLLDSIKVLAGLREASEETAAQVSSASLPRNASSKLSRGNKKGNKASAAVPVTAAVAVAIHDDADDSTAAPSPRVSLNGSSRIAKDKSSRAGSLPATREASVKVEDGAESVASSADGTSSVTAAPSGKGSANRPTSRIVLKLREIVFCRHDPRTFDKKGEFPEGEGILCRVTNVIGDGKQRRYEVQDADTSGDPPPPQRASVSQLMQIPENNKGLPDLPKGKAVIAQYPDTTTFYKAEVNESWRSKDVGDTDKGILVKLNFQDDESAREVERRFVLMDK